MRVKLAIAGVLLALVGAGFYWYSQQRGTKLSETDTILIGDFANTAGDAVFDGTLREALAVSLAQSPSLNLVSVEKVGEALRALGRPIDMPVTRDLAPNLCPRLGATVYLAGSIAKDGSGYALKLDATQCATGDAVVSVKSEAASKREALHALGVAASELRGKFGEDATSLQKFNLPLERATTGSLEALAAFTEGRRLVRDKGAMDAMPALKKAVELDSKFALAHSNLAVAYYNLNQNALAAEHIRQAFEAADRQVDLPGLEQELPGREPPDLAETSDAVDLGRGKDRKHLVEPRRQGAVGCGRLVLAGHVRSPIDPRPATSRHATPGGGGGQGRRTLRRHRATVESSLPERTRTSGGRGRDRPQDRRRRGPIRRGEGTGTLRLVTSPLVTVAKIGSDFCVF